MHLWEVTTAIWMIGFYQASMMEYFYKSGQWLTAAKYFRKKHHHRYLIGSQKCLIQWLDTLRWKLLFSRNFIIWTGTCDHHHLRYLILKSLFEKEELEKVTNQDFNQFQWEVFIGKVYVTSCDGSLIHTQEGFTKVVNSRATKKKIREW